MIKEIRESEEKMPELPEVETISKSLNRLIKGLSISHIELLYKPIFKAKNDSHLKTVRGKKIKKISRRGKYLIFDLEHEHYLIFHLKMTGRFILAPKKTQEQKHIRLAVQFEETGQDLLFHDIRKFGTFHLLPTASRTKEQFLSHLGPEPLKINREDFFNLFKNRKAKIKSLLLDQSFIAGIGNIYADEILFAARIHPATPADALNRKQIESLYSSMQEILRRAIRSKGSSIRDYFDLEGIQGSFQKKHQVYQRESLPCLCCGNPIQRMILCGRSSFFCPSCQPQPSTPHPPS